MKKMLLASAMLIALPFTPAKADLILTQPNGMPAGSITASFTDLGATGFGHAPRLLTEQTAGFESGSGTPVNVANGDAISGMDKTTTPTLATIGWTTGAQVGVGFNSNQTGGTGITLDSLVLTIYDSVTHAAIVSFSLSPTETPLNFSAADLALQQGNGNAVFNFGLNATEQAQFNALHLSSADFAGLASSLGCATGAPVGCMPSNDGADSFLAFVQPSAVPGPVAGAGIPGLFGLGMLALARLRQKREWWKRMAQASA